MARARQAQTGQRQAPQERALEGTGCRGVMSALRMGAMLGALASTFFLTFSKPVVAAGCRSISFDGEIAAGEAFVREIGGGLALHLTPTTFSDPAVDAALDGWNLALL